MLSILIATYNRCDLLKNVINSLVNQEDVSLGKDYEIIIADNNSSDDTKAVVQTFIQKYGDGIRYIFEPRQGKPYALNKAIPLCRGNWIWLTDDDVFIPADFIFRSIKFLACVDEDIYLMGAKLYPCFEESGRKDLESLVYIFPGCFAVHDKDVQSETWLNLSKNELNKIRPWGRIYGANMFVRKSVLEELGGYNTDYTYMQDTELSKRIMLSGYGALFSAELSIGHLISTERLSLDYIKKWYSRRAYIKCMDEGWYPKKWYHIKGIPIALLVFGIVYRILYKFGLLSLRVRAEFAAKLGVVEGAIACLKDRYIKKRDHVK